MLHQISVSEAARRLGVRPGRSLTLCSRAASTTCCARWSEGADSSPRTTSRPSLMPSRRPAGLRDAGPPLGPAGNGRPRPGGPARIADR